jgi:hypothetical protein
VGAFFALGSSRIGAHVSLAVTLAFTGVIAVVRPSFEIAATGLLTADRWQQL